MVKRFTKKMRIFKKKFNNKYKLVRKKIIVNKRSFIQIFIKINNGSFKFT